MKRSLKKYAALAFSLALAMCAPLSAAADEAGQAGSAGRGQMAEIKKQDVYQVLLPTDVSGVFDFMIDPQKLIEETDAAAYGGKSFEKGATVFFHRMDGQSAEEYSSSSDHVTITNRSTVPVEIMVNVSVSQESLGGITMTGDRTFAGDTGASLYMALTDGVNTVPVGTGDSWIRTTIPAAPEEAFEYIYDQERGMYHRGLKQDLSGIQFPEYSFQLVGAANEKGDWAALGKASPLVNVTWKVMPGQSLNSGEEAEEDLGLEENYILDQILETMPAGEGGTSTEADRNGRTDQTGDTDFGGNADQNSKPDQSGEADQNNKTDPDKKEDQSSGTDSEKPIDQNDGTDPEKQPDRSGGTDPEKQPDQNSGTEQNQNELIDSKTSLSKE